MEEKQLLECIEMYPESIRYSKGLLREMFGAISCYIKNKGRLQINNAEMQFKKLEKQNQPSPKSVKGEN